MKPTSFLIRLARLGLACLMILIVDLCTPPKKEPPPEPIPQPKPDYTVSGTITGIDGKTPIRDASITINDKEVRSKENGEFSYVAEPADRYVVTIKKRKFGMISKVFRFPAKEYKYRMRPAFEKVINPTIKNTVTDGLSSTSCTGTGFQNLKVDSAYKNIPLVYDDKGRLVNFGWPPDQKVVFDAMVGPPLCNPGATVMLPAGSIVDGGGQTVSAPVTISISTVDLQSPDGMPGDLTYQDDSGTGAMISLGAVIIEIVGDETNKEKKYKLNEKTGATVIIPVDPLALKFAKKFKQKIPDKIPVLYYDEKKGMWAQEEKQEAKFNPKTNSYEVKVKHFSAINMDYKMANPTCFRLRQVPGSASLQSPFRINMLFSAPLGANVSTTYGDEGDANCHNISGSNLHVVYNVPPSSPTQSSTTVFMTNNVYPSPNLLYGFVVVQLKPDTDTVPSTSISPCNCSGSTPNGNACRETCTPAPGALCPCAQTCETSCYNSKCGDIVLKTYNEDIILAVTPLCEEPNPALPTPCPDGSMLPNLNNGTERQVGLKWIFKNPPATGTTFEYQIEYENTGATAGTTTATCGPAFPCSPAPGTGTSYSATYTAGAINSAVVVLSDVSLSGPPGPLVRIRVTKIGTTVVSLPSNTQPTE